MGLGGIGRSCRLQLVAGLASAADPRPPSARQSRRWPGVAALTPVVDAIWTERLSKSTRATLHFRGEPYGVSGDSRRLPGPRKLVRLTAAEGANRHCEPLGMATRDQRIFDWLDRYLAA
jgi:hypothetical protein